MRVAYTSVKVNNIIQSSLPGRAGCRRLQQAELPPAPGQRLAVTAAASTGTGEVLQLGLDGTGTLMPRK